MTEQLALTLQGIARLALDTAPVIYFVEAHPQYISLVRPVFRLISGGQVTGVVSALTLGEVLVKPLTVGDAWLQAEFRDLLLRGANLDLHPIMASTSEVAADLRARYRIHMLDALQLAVALEQGCQAFLTNDLRLKRVTELRVLVLDELEP